MECRVCTGAAHRQRCALHDLLLGYPGAETYVHMAKERYLTADEVAVYLRVGPEAVYRLVRRGQLPAVRVGHQWRFRERDFLDWLRHAAFAQAPR